MRDLLRTTRPVRLPRRAAAFGLLLTFAAFHAGTGAASARAGDPAHAAPAPQAPAPQAAAPQAAAPQPAAQQPAPRLAAVDTEIRVLERRLQSLRKARTELNAGRPEPVPSEDAARRAHDADVRALREIARYEAARAKALGAAAQAAEAKDEARAADARSALEAGDRQFLESMERIAASREGARDDGKADGAQSPATKPPATTRPEPRRRGKASAETDDSPDEEEQEG